MNNLTGKQIIDFFKKKYTVLEDDRFDGLFLTDNIKKNG